MSESDCSVYWVPKHAKWCHISVTQSLPSTWVSMTNVTERYLAVLLNTTDAEYVRVESEFYKTMDRANSGIIKVSISLAQQV